MKKIRILALALVVAAMMMGVGYAQWTDTMVINNTVQTGELNVKFDEGTFYGIKYPDACAAQYAKASAQIDEKDPHTMTVNLNGLYPDSWVAFKVKGINAGTIPAKLDNIDVQFSGAKELLPYLTYETRIAFDPDGKNNNIKSFDLSGNLAGFGDDFNKYIKKDKALQAMQLEPNNMGAFYMGVPKNGLGSKCDCCGDIPDGYIIIRFDKSAPNELKNKTLTFTLTINFKQFNQ